MYVRRRLVRVMYLSGGLVYLGRYKLTNVHLHLFKENFLYKHLHLRIRNHHRNVSIN